MFRVACVLALICFAFPACAEESDPWRVEVNKKLVAMFGAEVAAEYMKRAPPERNREPKGAWNSSETYGDLGMGRIRYGVGAEHPGPVPVSVNAAAGISMTMISKKNPDARTPVKSGDVIDVYPGDEIEIHAMGKIRGASGGSKMGPNGREGFATLK